MKNYLVVNGPAFVNLISKLLQYNMNKICYHMVRVSLTFEFWTLTQGSHNLTLQPSTALSIIEVNNADNQASQSSSTDIDVIIQQ